MTPSTAKPWQTSVDDLRSSAAPDLYDPSTYIPWTWIEQELEKLAPAISFLNQGLKGAGLAPDFLAHALAQEGVLQVIRHILVSSATVGFADGREIPQTPPAGEYRRQILAQLFLDIGLGRILHADSSVEDAVRIGLIATDTRRRGFRRRDMINAQVQRALRTAVKEASAATGQHLRVMPKGSLHHEIRSRADHVIAVGEKPIAAVVSSVYSQSGGRQQRELGFGHPESQRQLNRHGIALVAIVDGRYVTEAPASTLQRLIDGVAYPMTLRQAESGRLTAALASAVNTPIVPEAVDAESVFPLIQSILATGRSIAAEDLPIGAERGRLALSSFAAANPEMALTLEPNAAMLRWRDSVTVARAYSVASNFDAEQAASLICGLLRMTEVEPVETVPPAADGLLTRMGNIPEDRVLPTSLVIATLDREPTVDDIKAVARTARRRSSDATLAVLLVPELPFEGSPATQSVQRSLATSVVVLTTETLTSIAQSKSPRDAFVLVVLEQADLSKANPFNATGATSRRMFFGRDEEEAGVLSTLDVSSVALLGGRRIGKTSLLQRVVGVLNAEGWAAYDADCQAVGDWASFASLVRSRWRVDLPDDFKPVHIQSLVSQLQKRTPSSRVVLAFDEIDYLLRWDQESHDENVPEAFFRSCRALSQQGAARFLFTGERFIAEKMWDPSSPHYNFCKPLSVQQLLPAAARSLLVQPLQALGVGFDDEAGATAAAWRLTSGHPHLLQYLGERIVAELNRRSPADRHLLYAQDIEQVGETAEYRQHYVETYWGQSNNLEKLVSVLIAHGLKSPAKIRARMSEIGIVFEASELVRSTRMLELYGLLKALEPPYEFRAEWFPKALDSVAAADTLIKEFSGQVK